MASSAIPAIRMKLLLFAIILGHLKNINTSEVPTVPQIPIQTENDILQEVETDGFLVHQILHPLLTTKTPQKTTTVQTAGNPSLDFNHFLLGDFTEGSTSGDTNEMVSQKEYEKSASIKSISTAVLQTDTTNSASVSSVNLTLQSELTSTSTANAYNRRISAGDNSVTDHTSFMFSESSSHNTESPTQSQTTNTSAAAKSIKETLILPSNVKGAGAIVDPIPSNKGHSTPDWIIILGFVVGVAALIMLCVAIATREKWNRPRQALERRKNTGSTDQQREVEMETFLQHLTPKENGKSAEYTVISLDELPDKYAK